MSVLIIDTGCANLSSVRFAIERLGVNCKISGDSNEIRSADKLLLPGVGHAQEAVKNLRQRGLFELVPSLTQPVLGICLGMQMMTAGSDEGDVETLNVIPGRVEPLDTQGLRCPHMGWNQITPVDHPLFHGIEAGSYFYFVHSYGVKVSEHTIARCEYGTAFSAALAYNNFMGVQFHPERSASAGAKLLKNFIEM